MNTKIIKLLSMIGGLICLLIIFYGLASLFNFLFLVHPVGDTLLAISWTNWLINLALVVLIIFIGILGCIDFYKTYFSKSVNVIKNSKRIIFSGSIFIILVIHSILSLFLESKDKFFVIFDKWKSTLLFQLPLMILPGLIIVLLGLFILKQNRSKFREEIDFEKQRKFSKKLKWLILIIIMILLVFSTISKLNNTVGKAEVNDIDYSEAIKRGKDSKIISAILQSRSIMVNIYSEDNNYDNFNCFNNEWMRIICNEIAKNHPIKGTNPVIAISPLSNSKAACIYSSLNSEDSNYWYCTDSEGKAGFYFDLENNPSYTCKSDGKSAHCPSLSYDSPDLYINQQKAKNFKCGDLVTFTYKDEESIYGTVESQGKCWLDRNLGADRVAIAHNDADAYGDLFQWGRLDDGHQDRSSATTTAISITDNPGHNNFIYGMGDPYDWRNPQNDNLWQGDGAINDPCPDGWRVPTSIEWDIERASWNSQNYNGAFASPLKLTAAGLRVYNYAEEFGVVWAVGGGGGYWSNSVRGDMRISYLSFAGGGASVYISHRASGLSVRCIKD